MENIEHTCKGRDSREWWRGYYCMESLRITVFLAFFKYTLLGCPFDSGPGPAVQIEIGSLRELIDITFCPFCGVDLKEQLASQNPPTSEAETGNNAAY